MSKHQQPTVYPAGSQAFAPALYLTASIQQQQQKTVYLTGPQHPYSQSVIVAVEDNDVQDYADADADAELNVDFGAYATSTFSHSQVRIEQGDTQSFFGRPVQA